MKKIILIFSGIVFLVSCGKVHEQTDLLSITNEQTAALAELGESDLHIGTQTSETINTSFAPANLQAPNEPFAEIPSTSVEFLLDYTQSSSITNPCLMANSSLRQKIPHFFFSIANQSSEMDVALGVSYFTNGEYETVIPVSREFRQQTTWYKEIINGPKFENSGDNYAEVIDDAITALKNDNQDVGEQQKREVLVMIGDGSYNGNPKEEILNEISEHNAELEDEGKSLEVYFLLYCTKGANKEMWESIDNNDFVSVFFINNEENELFQWESYNWLKKISKDIFGISDDNQFWLDDSSRDTTYSSVSGDSIYRMQGVSFNEGGQLRVGNSENIIETSRELPNLFLDQHQNMTISNSCLRHNVEVHYTGFGPVFQWLEEKKVAFLEEPSIRFFARGRDNIAVLTLKLPPEINRAGIESCYAPFLKLGTNNNIPVISDSPSCTSDVCLESSSLVSTFLINPDTSTNSSSIEYGFLRRDAPDVIHNSNFSPAPFLINQRIHVGYLDNSQRRLKYESQPVETVSIQIPLYFFNKDKWNFKITAYVEQGQNNVNTFLEGLPNDSSREPCPGTDFLDLSENSESIRYNIDQSDLLEILIMTNVGWDIKNDKKYNSYCNFVRFDIAFYENYSTGIAQHWLCAKERDNFICEFKGIER